VELAVPPLSDSVPVALMLALAVPSGSRSVQPASTSTSTAYRSEPGARAIMPRGISTRAPSRKPRAGLTGHIGTVGTQQPVEQNVPSSQSSEPPPSFTVHDLPSGQLGSPQPSGGSDSPRHTSHLSG